MVKRRNKVKGGLEPGLGVTFTPSRRPDDDGWIDTFNQMLAESDVSRTKLIIEMIRKGMKAYQVEQTGELVLTPREQQLILFMRQHGLSDYGGAVPENPSTEKTESKLASPEKHQTMTDPEIPDDNQTMDRLQRQLKGLQM